MQPCNALCMPGRTPACTLMTTFSLVLLCSTNPYSPAASPCRFCPCHGTHYDSSGRVRKGPAPYNLEVSGAQHAGPGSGGSSTPACLMQCLAAATTCSTQVPCAAGKSYLSWARSSLLAGARLCLPGGWQGADWHQPGVVSATPLQFYALPLPAGHGRVLGAGDRLGIVTGELCESWRLIPSSCARDLQSWL